VGLAVNAREAEIGSGRANGQDRNSVIGASDTGLGKTEKRG
jgi:hypothetical protein